MKHVLVRVRRGGGCSLVEGTHRWYTSLRDLVMKVPALKTLYPNTPKEDAFNDEETPPPVTGRQLGGGRKLRGEGLGTGKAGANLDAAGTVCEEPPPLVLYHWKPLP